MGSGVATLDFREAPVAYEFIASNCFVAGILGPVGSGKSTACTAKLMRHAMEQAPDKDGWKRTRWAVIRNTSPELKTTTIKTWEDRFGPEVTGSVVRYSSPITHRIIRPPKGDHLGVDIEVLFIPLDRPKDAAKLKSMELTGAWVNEAIEVPWEIVDLLTGRVGRYPSEENGGCTWAGVMMDTNACDDTNWWYRVSEQGDREQESEIVLDGRHYDLSWRFWKQPPSVAEVAPKGGGYVVSEPGLEPRTLDAKEVMTAAGRYWTVNDGAENLPFLRGRGFVYYAQQIKNRSLESIQRFLQGKYVYMVDGKPVVPEYSDDMMARDVPGDPSVPLVIGMDIGGGTLKPSAVYLQKGPFGDWRQVGELCVFDMGVDRFTDLLKQDLANRWAGYTVGNVWGDPACIKRDEIYEVVVANHMKARGIPLQAAPSQDPKVRRDAIAAPMGRLIRLPDGQTVPGFLIDKSCVMTRGGLAGKWYYRKIQLAGTDRYAEKPDKGDHSHACDALGYGLLGGGEHAMMTRPGGNKNSWAAQGSIAMKVEIPIFDAN